MKITQIVLLLCINIVIAQNNVTLNVGLTKEKKYHSSFDFQDIKGKIIIDVVVNNQNRKFILDTGAPTSISENLLSEINYNPIKDIPVHDANNKVNDLKIVQIPEISISGVPFLNSYALKISDMSILECFNVDGIIGSNMLRNSVVEFDFKNKKITISSSIQNFAYSKLKASKMYFRDFQSSPFLNIKMKIGDINLTEMLLFDSGDDSFYSLSTNTYDQIITQVQKKQAEEPLQKLDHLDLLDMIASSDGSFSLSLHGNDETNLYHKFKIQELVFDTTTFDNIISTTTYGNHSRIGSEILYHGKLTLDYKRKKYYFQPNNSTQRINLNHKIRLFYPTYENDKFIIGIVWDKEMKEKMNVGDEILKINNVDFSKLSKCEIFRKSIEDFADSDTLTIKLKDFKTGEVKIVEVPN